MKFLSWRAIYINRLSDQPQLDSFRKTFKNAKLFLPPFINEINLLRTLEAEVKNCKTVDRDKKRPWTAGRPEIERHSLIYGGKIQSVFETGNQPSRKFTVLFTGRSVRFYVRWLWISRGLRDRGQTVAQRIYIL